MLNKGLANGNNMFLNMLEYICSYWKEKMVLKDRNINMITVDYWYRDVFC